MIKIDGHLVMLENEDGGLIDSHQVPNDALRKFLQKIKEQHHVVCHQNFEKGRMVGKQYMKTKVMERLKNIT